MRWTESEGEQPVARVAHHVEEDVDFIFLNLPGQAFVRPTLRDVPRRGRRAKAGGKIVFRGSVVIAENGTTRRIERFEQRQREKPGWMATEIGGDKTDAQWAGFWAFGTLRGGARWRDGCSIADERQGVRPATLRRRTA